MDDQTDNVSAKPPRARVADAPLPEETAAEKLERKRDYLEGFLQQQPAAVAAGEPGGAIYEAVIDALKGIYDPEIPVNIYELGLIYKIDVHDDNAVTLDMTLTSPNCPVAESLPGEVQNRIEDVPGVGNCEVRIVWDPPWHPSMMTEEAQLELGLIY